MGSIMKTEVWISYPVNIFVGIKETGAFQHSSFTAGGIVTSAGLISVKQGTIYTLSPLSGHYRTSTNVRSVASEYSVYNKF
jgi:hypothetical protein